MRTVRKELLLLRAEVERAEFVRARLELRASLHRFGWLKLLLPAMPGRKTRHSGTAASKGLGATLADWINHPLVGTLASTFLAKPLRGRLAAGTKPLLKWGALSAVAWTGFSALARMARRRHGEAELEND
jgi:hypothetical protein